MPRPAVVILLSLNPGSTSLRFELARVAAGGGAIERLAGGSISRIGSASAMEAGAGEAREPVEGAAAGDHAQAVRLALEWLDVSGARARRFFENLDGVGVRVVRPAERSHAPARVDGELIAEMERAPGLAPLHQGPCVEALRGALAAVSESVPVVAISDSAFFGALPAVARACAIPAELAERHGIRRQGYHGLAVASVLERFGAGHGPQRRAERAVVLHLGGGASVTAVRRGRAVETSMGFSPLEGLVMVRRSGTVDPTLLIHLARLEGVRAEEVARWLGERSGMFGISGGVADMREIERRRAEGDPRAGLAFDVFAHSARMHLGAALAALGGADAVLFSGGIGERSPAVRAAICAGMEWCGISLDSERNAAATGGEAAISRRLRGVGVHVVPADEQRLIALETAAFLRLPLEPPRRRERSEEEGR